MLRTAFTASLAALVLAGARPARADSDADVKAIIAKAIEAKGGAANVGKYGAYSYKFKGKFHGAGIEADMTGNVRMMAPDKQRTEADLDNAGNAIKFLQVLNGKKGWISINGNPDEMSDDALKEVRESVHAEELALLRGLSGEGVKLSSLGESKVDGKTAVGVKVSAKDYRDVSLFFDKDTGELLKTETKAKDPMSGDEFTQIRTYGDYRKINGLAIPHKRTEKRNDAPYMEIEVTEAQPVEKLEDKDFPKPE